MKTIFNPTRTAKAMVLSVFLASSFSAIGQSLSTKTSKVTVDFTDPKKSTSTSFPNINWVSPLNETVFQKERTLDLKATVESHHKITKVSIFIKELTQANRGQQAAEEFTRAKKVMQAAENEKYSFSIDRRITLLDGVNEVQIVAENEQGIIAKSSRFIHVGETLLADASKLDRTDYALVVVTNNYDNWPKLTNPVFDGRSIASELEKAFGFKVDLIENPSQDQIWAKLREYAERKYKPLDQLFIFFAGHGHFDDTFKEGYLVTKESIPNDAGNTTYISHNRLRNNINNIPCQHIMLTMDVCFGGTFDEAIASRGAFDPSPYKEISQSEFIARKLAYKTRKYLTSGGKEYVSDGAPGHHSPFAAKLLEAMASRGGKDGLLSLNELLSYIEKLNPEPKYGKFGDDAPGSEFIFVVK